MQDALALVCLVLALVTLGLIASPRAAVIGLAAIVVLACVLLVEGGPVVA